MRAASSESVALAKLFRAGFFVEIVVFALFFGALNRCFCQQLSYRHLCECILALRVC